MSSTSTPPRKKMATAPPPLRREVSSDYHATNMSWSGSLRKKDKISVWRSTFLKDSDGDTLMADDGETVVVWTLFDTPYNVGTFHERRFFKIIEAGQKRYYDNPEAWQEHCTYLHADDKRVSIPSPQAVFAAKQAWLAAAREDWVRWALNNCENASNVGDLSHCWDQEWSRCHRMLMRGESATKLKSPLKVRPNATWADEVEDNTVG